MDYSEEPELLKVYIICTIPDRGFSSGQVHIKPYQKEQRMLDSVGVEEDGWNKKGTETATKILCRNVSYSRNIGDRNFCSSLRQ